MLRVNDSLVIMESETATCWNVTLGRLQIEQPPQREELYARQPARDGQVAQATVTDQATA